MIDEQIVQNTWKDVAQASPDTATKQMGILAQNQPNLLAFIMAQVAHLKPEIQELGVYLFFVVFRIFENSTTTPIETISEEAILGQMDKTDSFFAGLAQADEEFVFRMVEVESAQQPHVMGYVMEAILEAPQDEESLEISDEEGSILFGIFKTVVDVLDRHVETSPKKP